MSKLYRINLETLSWKEREKIAYKTNIPVRIIPARCRLLISENFYYLIWFSEDTEAPENPDYISIFAVNKNYQVAWFNYKIISEWKPKLTAFLQILIQSFDHWQKRGFIQELNLAQYTTHPNKEFRELICKDI